MALTTLREEITRAMEGTEDSIETLEAINCETLDLAFDNGYGGSEGQIFCAWSKDWVYFPAVYDGSEWVERVRRNPTPGYVKAHVGGE